MRGNLQFLHITYCATARGQVSKRGFLTYPVLRDGCTEFPASQAAGVRNLVTGLDVGGSAVSALQLAGHRGGLPAAYGPCSLLKIVCSVRASL